MKIKKPLCRIALFSVVASLVMLGGCFGNNSKTPSSSVGSESAPEEMLLSAKHIYQLDKWPTGCESVSAVMALESADVNVTVDDFIDNYLNCTSRPFDPEKSFGGDPRSQSGKGCYAPVIKAALDKALKGTGLAARQLKGLTVKELCEKYIAKGTPVIFWGTLDMAEPFEGDSWEFEGKKITWIRPEHCLLLVGYNADSYIFCDPMREEDVTYYPKAAVETAYKALYSQAVVIEKTASDAAK